MPDPIQPTVQNKSKRTLENRVNELSWKDWLLFQKSFFAISEDEALYGGLIQFFTKRHTPEGRESRVLAVTVAEEPPVIETHGRILSTESVTPAKLGCWSYGETEFVPFDFLIVDLRHGGSPLIEQVTTHADGLRHFLAECRSLLKPGGFCALLSREVETATGRYPLPWMLASLARHSFRLRDERLGLPPNSEAAPTYVNVLQVVAENGPIHTVLPELQVGASALRAQWVKPKPKPRSKKEILHPAKFPEELVRTFVAALTEEGAVVFDPMGGTGSTAMAALSVGRKAAIIELGEAWAELARGRLMGAAGENGDWRVLQGDARSAATLLPAEFQPVGYTVTSPPYWRILHNPGMHVSDEGQKARQAKGLRTTYSECAADLGNVGEYGEFIDELAKIYEGCAEVMSAGCVLTIVTKNVKHERVQYPIAWDLVFRLCRAGGLFEYAGNTFWCQDDVGLKPFGMGCDWISNILHNYCLHLRVQ